MNSLPIIEDLSGFTQTAILLGEGQRADRIWTREEFVLLAIYAIRHNPGDDSSPRPDETVEIKLRLDA